MTPREAVEAQLPRLADEQYRITSPEDPKYNCFAWAANDNTRLWSPTLLGGGVYWPPGIPARAHMDGVVEAYAMTGYARCESPDPEAGFEKIAIFADKHGEPRHAARRLLSGGWASKLGDHVDIEHDNLAAVGGEFYGEPAVFMRRSLEDTAAPPAPRVRLSVPGVDPDVIQRLTAALQRRRPAYELLAPPADAEEAQDDPPKPTTGAPTDD